MGERGECGHGKFDDSESPMRIKFFDGKVIVKICAGNHHTLALTSNNELYSWGAGTNGQCGYGEFENTAIPQIVNFPGANFQTFVSY
jgi:alpha-tubulin suppressor-like RCC1 family protein